VRACAESGMPMAVVPGPTAVSAALAAAGFVAQQHLFLGFLPSRTAERRQALRRAGQQPAPIVCFEAPHRLRESLEDIRAVLDERQTAVAREITKRFEEIVRGTASELIAHFAEHPPRGEVTIVIAGGAPEEETDIRDALAEMQELAAGGLAPSRAAAHVAKWRKLSRRQLYQAFLRRKGP